MNGSRLPLNAGQFFLSNWVAEWPDRPTLSQRGKKKEFSEFVEVMLQMELFRQPDCKPNGPALSRSLLHFSVCSCLLVCFYRFQWLWFLLVFVTLVNLYIMHSCSTFTFEIQIIKSSSYRLQALRQVKLCRSVRGDHLHVFANTFLFSFFFFSLGSNFTVLWMSDTEAVIRAWPTLLPCVTRLTKIIFERHCFTREETWRYLCLTNPTGST